MSQCNWQHVTWLRLHKMAQFILNGLFRFNKLLQFKKKSSRWKLGKKKKTTWWSERKWLEPKEGDTLDKWSEMVCSGMSEPKLEWQKWAILPERCLRRGTAGSKTLQGHVWFLQAVRKAGRGGCREDWCEGIFIFCRDSTARDIDLGSSYNCPSASGDHLSAIWRNGLTP